MNGVAKMQTKNCNFLINMTSSERDILMITTNPQQVFGEITLANPTSCEIMGLDNIHEANALAHQRYGYHFNAYPRPVDEEMMKVPVNGIFCIGSKEVPPPQEIPQMSNKFWSFTALNSFGTSDNLSDLIHTMLDLSNVYPIANLHPTKSEAIETSRKNYVSRFYQRYDAKIFSPDLPQRVLYINEIFTDQNFAERERNRLSNDVLNRFLSLGLMI